MVVVEPPEIERPWKANEVRPGGVGIKPPRGADIVESPIDGCELDAGTFDPRMTTGDRVVCDGADVTYGLLL